VRTWYIGLLALAAVGGRGVVGCKSREGSTGSAPSASAVTSEPVGKPVVVADALPSLGDVQIAGDTIYFGSQDGVFSVPTKGGIPTAVSKGADLYWPMVVGSELVWGEERRLVHASISGGAVEPAPLATAKNVAAIATDGRSVYFYDENLKLSRVAPTGGASEHLLVVTPDGKEEPFLALIVCANPTDAFAAQQPATVLQIYREGQLPVRFPELTGVKSISGLAADETHVYVLAKPNKTTCRIARLPLSGGPQEDLATDGEGRCPSRIVVDRDRVYWVIANRLRSVPKAGGTVETVVSENQLMSGFAFAGDYLYWGTAGSKDGSNHDAHVSRMRLR
jgi:hypothetical protein